MSKRTCLSLGFCVCVLVATSACQRYTAKPLNDQVVAQRLAMPAQAQLQREINSIHNPLMPRISVNLESGLTPAMSGAIAVAHNPTVAAQRDTMLGAEANLLQARILPNPQLTANADVPFGPGSAGNVVAYGLGLDWEFTSLISYKARTRAARAGAEEVRLDVAWTEWQAAEASKMALYDVVAIREQLALTRQLNAVLTKVADQARAALQQHNMTAPDASAAETAAQDNAVLIATGERDLADAQLALNQALGFPPDAETKIDPSVTLPMQIDPPDIEKVLAHLDTRRIDLAALRRGYESQEQTVRAAILGQFPKISLGISNTRDYGDFLTLGPALTIDIPIFDRNQGVIAAARATRQRLFDEYIARLFEARSSVARAVTLIHSLNEVIKAQEKEVQMLRNFVAEDEKALKSGNLDAATYFTAAVNLSQKQVDLVKLRQDLVHAEISLEIAAGVVLPINPNPSPREGTR
ncbi:MAG: TolC family protein [Phycisphaerae bacterium]